MANDEDRASIVRLIFEKYVYEGYGVHRLANYLNDTYPGDKIWHPTSINTVLRNSAYTGRFHFDEIQSASMENLRIISDDLFNQVRDIMKSRATREPVKQRGVVPLRTTGQYLLTGLLYCGECGSCMVGSMTYKKRVSRGEVIRSERRIYRCYGKFITATDCNGQSTFSADRIEKAVDAIVREYLATFQTTPYMEAFRKARQEAEKKARAKREEVQKRLNTLEREVALLKEEVLRSLAGASAFDRDELNSLLLEKRTALGEVQQDYDNLRSSDEDSWLNETQAEYKRLSGWAEQYPDASLEAKRMILHHLIERVTLKRGYQLEIKLTISAQQFFGAEGEYLTTRGSAWGCQSDQVVRATMMTEKKVTVTSPSLQLKVANV